MSYWKWCLVVLVICSYTASLAGQDVDPLRQRHLVSTKAILSVGQQYNAKYEYALGPRSGLFGEVQHYAIRERPSVYSAALRQTLYVGETITAQRNFLFAAGYRRYFGGRGTRGQWFGEGAALLLLPGQETDEWTAAMRLLLPFALPSRRERLASPGLSAALGYQYSLPKGFTVEAQYGFSVFLARELSPSSGRSRGLDVGSGGGAASMLTVGKRF